LHRGRGQRRITRVAVERKIILLEDIGQLGYSLVDSPQTAGIAE
jgi:hypothetical protein